MGCDCRRPPTIAIIAGIAIAMRARALRASDRTAPKKLVPLE